MDLLQILRSKIDILQEGDYILGLQAVLSHIETAYRHLLRGQELEDEAAFTDAIYRTNQAFEGSLKEAYRVLAQKNPEKERPFDIENFLFNNNIFRQRVLDQFTNYRKDWRNPSTHDYTLSFDDSEAFLAIVSVTAFACLLLDQITEKLSYLQVKTETDSKQREIQKRLASVEKGNLLRLTTEILREFSHQQPAYNVEGSKRSEAQFLGELEGFFASVAPDLEVVREFSLNNIRIDLIISDKSSRVLIEIKRISSKEQVVFGGVEQLKRLTNLTGIKYAILYLFSDTGGELEIQEHSISNIDGKIRILKSQ